MKSFPFQKKVSIFSSLAETRVSALPVFKSIKAVARRPLIGATNATCEPAGEIRMLAIAGSLKNFSTGMTGACSAPIKDRETKTMHSDKSPTAFCNVVIGSELCGSKNEHVQP